MLGLQDASIPVLLLPGGELETVDKCYLARQTAGCQNPVGRDTDLTLIPYWIKTNLFTVCSLL